jgi:hypothetical protein
VLSVSSVAALASILYCPRCRASSWRVAGSLHHSAPIGEVAANVARMLRPGGRIGLIEPYCADEAAKESFGRAQIEAGIGEQTYLLREWHEAFARDDDDRARYYHPG